MTDENEVQAQAELDTQVLQNIADAQTDDERELAIAAAIVAGYPEPAIRAAAGLVDDPAEESASPAGEGFPDDVALYDSVPVQGSVTLSLLMTIQNPGSLAHAMDSFNASLGRFGTDAFYIIARDEAGEEWVLTEGRVVSADQDDPEEDGDEK